MGRLDKLLIFLTAITLVILFSVGSSQEAEAAIFKDNTHQEQDENIPTEASIAPFTQKHTFGYSLSKVAGVYNIYLGVEIGGLDSYRDLIIGLKALSTRDKVIIHMSNYGGSVMTGVQIANAMKASQAKVIVELEGPSYSMGALLTCTADEVIYHDYAYLMFHTFSGSFNGKASDSKKHMIALETMLTNMLQSECKPKGILSDKQIEDIMNGVDVYVHPKDIKSNTNSAPDDSTSSLGR